jgi:hypothetical protein
LHHPSAEKWFPEQPTVHIRFALIVLL